VPLLPDDVDANDAVLPTDQGLNGVVGVRAMFLRPGYTAKLFCRNRSRGVRTAPKAGAPLRPPQACGTACSRLFLPVLSVRQ
jgi:hypothetical protein